MNKSRTLILMIVGVLILVVGAFTLRSIATFGIFNSMVMLFGIISLFGVYRLFTYARGLKDGQ